VPAVAATSANRKLHRILLVLSCLVVAAQISANLFLLHAARNADYNKIAAELRSVIPPGQTAYGTITFWLALHDRPFILYEPHRSLDGGQSVPCTVLHYRRRVMTSRRCVP